MTISPPITAHEQQEIAHTLSYPFALQEKPFVFWDGKALPIKSQSIEILETIVEFEGVNVSLREIARIKPELNELNKTHFHAVIASGSNASPKQLQRKFSSFGKRSLIPVLKGSIVNSITVYSAHFARKYCSVPATLSFEKNAQTEIFCTLIPDYMLESMHRSEHIGINYGYFRLNGVDFLIDGSSLPINLHAYVSLWGSLMLNHEKIRLPQFKSNVDWIPSLNQEKIMSSVRDLLEPTMTLQEFILGMLRSDELRMERIRKLSGIASALPTSDAFERLK